MGFRCSICSESLEEGPGVNAGEDPVPSENANLSSTSCGHLFHTFCINKWKGISSNCPCCRKRVVRCIQIFPNSYDETFSEEGNMIPRNQGEEIHILKSEMRKISNDKFALEQRHKLLQQDYEKFHIERVNAQTVQTKYNESKIYKVLYLKLKDEFGVLEAEKQKYLHLDAMLKGVKHDVKEDLKNFPPNDEKSVISLLGIKNVLQSELETCRINLSSSKKDNEKLRSHNHTYYSRIQSLEQERRKLTIANDNEPIRENRKEYEAGPSSSRKPKAERNKFDATILIPDEDDDIKADVGVLIPFTFNAPRKRAHTADISKKTTTGNFKKAASQPSIPPSLDDSITSEILNLQRDCPTSLIHTVSTLKKE